MCSRRAKWGCAGAEAADNVVEFAAYAGGDGLVFEHGEVEGVAGEGGIQVGFYASAHAFEDDQVGVVGGGVQVFADLREIDEGFASAGADQGDWEVLQGEFDVQDLWPP